MKKALKTIVVEDELLPRLTLLKKLDDFPQLVQVVDACEDYESARESILLNRPDLLLLDIQLNGKDSIQLLEELQKAVALPYVIFTTAYSDRKYLMSAIKLSAVDYLLKPVGKAELAVALAKAAERAFLDSHAGGQADEKLRFKTGNGHLFLLERDIAWFKADGNYTNVYTFSGRTLILENLLSLEQRLPRYRFSRIDRSTIVNLDLVCRVNEKEQICYSRTDEGHELELKLSKHGMTTLLAAL
jgi:two-component system LytT family response regulator